MHGNELPCYKNPFLNVIRIDKQASTGIAFKKGIKKNPFLNTIRVDRKKGE